MKIIVTGCKGQLGTEILKQLREGRSEISDNDFCRIIHLYSLLAAPYPFIK